MININLVPPERQKKRKSSFLPGSFSIPLEVVIGLGGGLLIILMGVHILFLFTNMSKMAELKKLKKEWEALLPEKQTVDKVVNEMRSLQTKLNTMHEIIGEGETSWSRKLNIMSDGLPRGVWLRRVALENEVLFIEGSSVSRESGAMINVHTFVANLNEADEFLKGFAELEISSIQRRMVNKLEIADFLVTTDILK